MPRWPSEAERVWERADIRGEDECWPWLSHIKPNGYGVMNGRLAHRLAYRHAVGEIPEGLTLDHLCRNRACVNPRHLEPVSQRVNILRGEGLAAQNARKTHCTEGHPLSGTPGHRRCRICRRQQTRDSMRRWRERQRLAAHYNGGTPNGN